MNESLFLFFYNFSHRSELVDNIIVFFALYFPYLVTIAAGVFLLMHHEVFKADNTWQVFVVKKKEVSRAFLVGIAAWILAQILKFIFATPRPAVLFEGLTPLLNKTDFSFPSGHATFFMALAFSIFFSHKRAGLIFMLCALVIGLARIAAGVHFPVDILGGFVLGAIVAYFAKKI